MILFTRTVISIYDPLVIRQKSTNNSYHILEICQINIPNIQIEERKQIYNVCIDINK